MQNLLDASYVYVVTANFNQQQQKNNLMTPFYGWDSIASWLEPLRGGSLLSTTKFPKFSVTHFMDLGRIKG